VEVVVITLGFAGCQKKIRADPATGNIIITRLSHPDEALNAIVKETEPSLWGNYLVRDAVIAATDRATVGFLIGARSANALLAVFLDDYEAAERIGESIKRASEKLNIKSARVETIAEKLLGDLEISDEQDRARHVKSTLNLLTDAIVAALRDIGSRNEALMIEYGVWIEAIKQISGIVKDDYSPKSAAVLRRQTEARYFKSEFQSLSLSQSREVYETDVEAASVLLNLMKANEQKSISVETVVRIHEAAARAFRQSAGS
jgi:hypothetical protein